MNKTKTAALLIAVVLTSTLVSYAQSPTIPEEARKYFVMGTTIFKEAKSAEDFTLAISKFKRATELAPEWPDARYNLATAREAAGDYSGAMADLKTYLQFKLSEAEARTAQDKLYVLEAKQEKAANDKEVSAKKAVEEAQAKAEMQEKTKASEQADFLKRINGARYSCTTHGEVVDYYLTLDVQGDTITTGECITRSSDPSDRNKVGVWRRVIDTFKIDGRTLRHTTQSNVTGTITDDGSTITTMSNGKVLYVYKRER